MKLLRNFLVVNFSKNDVESWFSSEFIKFCYKKDYIDLFFQKGFRLFFNELVLDINLIYFFSFWKGKIIKFMFHLYF